MNFHPDSFSITQYILETYPQLIAPIEEILWTQWVTGDDIPNGKDSISTDFFFLSMTVSNIDKDISIDEINFIRDIKDLFDEDFTSISSATIHKIYKESYDRNPSFYSNLSKPSSIIFLENYDAQHKTNYSDIARAMYFRFVNELIKSDGKITDEEVKYLENFKELLYPTIKKEIYEKGQNQGSKKTLEDLLNELNSLTGLENVKKDVQELVNFLEIQQIRSSKGMVLTPISRHLVFYGNPGTGKTTIARLLSEIYRCLNILSKGHLVETDRAGLVAGYTGQTAIKVQEVFNKALGGILFIDEAYSLNGEGNDFGSEAIDTLLKLMEDNRNDIIVIVAGYTEKMNKFLSSNPGFKSRFNKYISFEDYSPLELKKIFESFCSVGGFKLSQAANAKVFEIFSLQCKIKDESFGNGRLARNLFEQSVNNQANRIIYLSDINEDVLSTFEVLDIPNEIKNKHFT